MLYTFFSVHFMYTLMLSLYFLLLWSLLMAGYIYSRAIFMFLLANMKTVHFVSE